MHTSRGVAHQEGAAVVDIGRDSLNPGPIAIDATHATEIGMATPFLQARRGSADQEIVIDRLERGQEINKQLGAVAGAPKRQAQRCRALGEVRRKFLAVHVQADAHNDVANLLAAGRHLGQDAGCLAELARRRNQ